MKALNAVGMHGRAKATPPTESVASQGPRRAYSGYCMDGRGR